MRHRLPSDPNKLEYWRGIKLTMTTRRKSQPFIWGTGRRKTAVARVRIREGTGQFVVNRPGRRRLLSGAKSSATCAGSPGSPRRWRGRIDVFVNVQGSGKHSQSGAVALGLARALQDLPA